MSSSPLLSTAAPSHAGTHSGTHHYGFIDYTHSPSLSLVCLSSLSIYYYYYYSTANGARVSVGTDIEDDDHHCLGFTSAFFV